MEVKQSNPKAFEELELKLKELQGYTAKIGWFDTAKYPDGTPVAYVAAIQELGCEQRSIPPRPFMRPAQIKNAHRWFAVAEDQAQKIIEGSQNGRGAMEVIAQMTEDDVSDAIIDVNSPALSKITLAARRIREKGGKVTGATIGDIARRLASDPDNVELSSNTKPLNDTGYMLATLTHMVEST